MSAVNYTVNGFVPIAQVNQDSINICIKIGEINLGQFLAGSFQTAVVMVCEWCMSDDSSKNNYEILWIGVCSI